MTAAGEKLLFKARPLLGLNDEIWAMMSGEPDRGRLRFGVPYDLVGSVVAPILKDYASAFPHVELSLVCGASPDLVSGLAEGTLDVALVEEPVDAVTRGERLRIERLVWVGARGGGAAARTPLNVSMVAESCAFRPSVLAALEADGRPWRTIFESGSIEATRAMVRADLAVTAWLACTVPGDLSILDASEGLPQLPPFSINLHLPKAAATQPARTMADIIRRALVHTLAA